MKTIDAGDIQAHTPLPWTWHTGLNQDGTLKQDRDGSTQRCLIGADGQGFAWTVGLRAMNDVANVELILRAVNSHDALVAIVEKCAAFFEGTDAPLGIEARAALAKAVRA